jgi:hypothetical protein
MRTSDPGEQTYQIVYNLNSFLINTAANMLRQVNELYNNLGAILVAPLFFFALLHPFKREAIAKFRWIVLLMWIMGALGMATFGLSYSALDANQLHVLFAPVMTAYGLAFVSILWARIDLPAGSALMRYGHFVIVVLISAGPLILTIPRGLTQAIATQDRAKAVWLTGGLFAPHAGRPGPRRDGWSTSGRRSTNDDQWPFPSDVQISGSQRHLPKQDLLLLQEAPFHQVTLAQSVTVNGCQEKKLR